MYKRTLRFYIGIFTITVHLIQLSRGFTRPRNSREPKLKISPDLDRIFWGSELNSDEYQCMVQKRKHGPFIYPKRNVEHLLYNVNLENSNSKVGSTNSSVGSNNSSVVSTNSSVGSTNSSVGSTAQPKNGTEEKYTHPLAGLLVMLRFDEFKATLEEALREFLGTGQELPDKLHYELFVFASFFPINKVFKCIPITGKGNQRTCDHILIPNPGKGDFAFVIKYVMAPSEEEVQSSADSGLKGMLEKRVDKALLKSNPHVKYVYSICISFYNTKVGLAYVDEKCNEEVKKT